MKYLRNALLILALLCFDFSFAPYPAFADSIAFVGTAAHANGSGTSLTFNHTISTGSNLVEVVSVFAQGTTITGVTVGGVSASLAKSQKYTSNNDSAYEFYLDNPPTGAQSIVISSSVSLGLIVGVAGTYSGIAQTAPEATGSNTQNSNSNFTVSATTVTNNAWVIGTLFQNDGSLSAAAGTIRGQDTDTALIDNGPISPAGSASVTTHPSGGANEAVGVVAVFAPAAAAPSSFGDLIFFQ